MNERIKEIRLYFGLTQVEFGRRIGVKQSAVTGYENGNRQPLDTVITSICREFGVNEEWLRTGEGPQFIEITRAEQIQQIAIIRKPSGAGSSLHWPAWTITVGSR